MNAWMDGIKREELEKACKKKDHKVRARMAAARMVRVPNMSVGETASLQVRCPAWVRRTSSRFGPAKILVIETYDPVYYCVCVTVLFGAYEKQVVISQIE